MDLFNKLFKSAKKQPSPQQLEMLTNDQKMNYILEKIKEEHSKLMADIENEFEQKIEYQQSVCYQTYPGDMDKFAECACNIKSSAVDRFQFYKKKVAFISLATSRCLFQQKKPVPQCKILSLALSHSIMQSQLNFIRNWNPSI